MKLYRFSLCIVLLVSTGIGTSPAQSDRTRRQIDALLGMHDTFVAPEQWTMLGAEAAKILESIATDTSAPPSKRARALEGITQIKGIDAAPILRTIAHDRKESAAVRMAAIHGLGRVLPANQLLPALRLLLNDESHPGIRGSAAEVLMRDNAGRIEAHERGKKESPGWRARFLNEHAAAPVSSPTATAASASPSTAQSKIASPTAPTAPASTSGIASPSAPAATSSTTQTIDLTPGGPISVSTTQLTTFVTLTVPAGALSFDIFGTAVSNPTARVVVYRIVSPDGTLYDYSNASSLMQVLPPGPDSFSVLAPNSPSLPFSPGAWQISLLASAPTTASVKAIIKSGTSPTNGKLDMNLFFVGTGNVTATTAQTDQYFQGMLNAVRNIYAQAGIQIGNVAYLDITGNAAAQYSDLDDANLGALCQLSATAGAQANAVNLFFVHTITGSSLPGYVILGESAGIPGLPLNGTTLSGVAVSTSDFPSGDILATWAHEMGHWLGLFHPTEAGGTSFDKLADTPQCGLTHDANADKIMETSECVGFGADNLMWWTTSTNTLLTPNQAFVLLRNPLVRDPSFVFNNYQFTSESCTPSNNAADPGETVTLNVTVQNIGASSTGNVIGTMQASANIANPSGPKNFGPIASGAMATQPFTFTVNGKCGQVIPFTIQMQDDSGPQGSVTLSLALGALQAGSTSTAITNADHGPSDPYPSNIYVFDDGPATVTKVTVTLNNFSHTQSGNFSHPNDVSVLLVGPQGQKVVLMRGVGNGQPISGVNLTFDDAAASQIPGSTIVSGTYKPSDQAFNLPISEAVFEPPAPPPAYDQTLSVFNGTDPGGVWSLYVRDSQTGNSGTIAGGWTLNLTTNGATDNFKAVCSTSCVTPTPTPTPTPTATPTPIPNTSPSIAPSPNGRQKGTAAFSSTIATVSDAESSPGSLTVTAITVPVGLTISDIVNTNGTVKAKMAASCDISVGHKTIVLQVSDGNLTTNANLDVNVIANPIPTLSYNNNPASIPIGGSTTVSPTSASDNGSIVNFSLVSQGTYTGTIFVNGLTGLVSFSNATPAGSHTITIRATDNCGGTKDASFTLPIFDPSALDPLDANITGGGYVKATALQPDGKLIIAGSFDHVLGQPRNNIARLNANGTLDTFDPNALTGEVDSVVVQPDGKVVLAGFFTDLRPNGVFTSRNGIARVNVDGTVDNSFDPNPSGSVSCMALQPDAKILVGGGFTSIGGQTRSRIARLNTNGTADTFNPNVTSASTGVASIAVQADGKVVLGGSFTTLRPNGVGTTFTRNRIARVDSTGAVDTFDPSVTTASSSVATVAVQADGKVLLGGSFTTVGGQTRNRIARVDSTGAVDSFNPNAGSGANINVYCFVVQTDGKVLIAGDFTTLQPNGAPSPTTRNRIARVNSDGTFDTGFDPNASPFSVMTVALQPDGKVLLGGQFTSLKPNGAAVATPRNWFARMFNDPATQTLTAPDTSQVLWSRSGACPELLQVTFELSTDGGTNWTPLGNGTRVGTTSNWKLTGLSLPTSGQVRARGNTTNGFFNGSSGLIEQVVAYTASAPLPLTLAISGVGTATYSAGFNITSITMTFTSPPNISVNMQYSTDLSSWTAFGGNPVNTGATGTFPVTFTASGDQTALWNKKMFFKASTP